MTELHILHNYGPLAVENKLTQFREIPSTQSTASTISISQLPRAEPGVASILLNTSQIKDKELEQLFTENVAAKLWRVAQRDLKNNVNLALIFQTTLAQMTYIESRILHLLILRLFLRKVRNRAAMSFAKQVFGHVDFSLAHYIPF